jgi:hypothetical protein
MFGWAGVLAFRRLISQWRSLLTVIAGVVLSAAVGALVPLYTTAVSQVSMVEQLAQLPPDAVHIASNLSLTASGTNAAQSDFLTQAEAYNSRFAETARRYLDPFPGWLNTVVFYGETSALDIQPPAETTDAGSRIPDATTRVVVAYYEGWTESVTLIDGTFPDAASDPDTDNQADIPADIQIVVPFEAYNETGVRIGDVLILDQGGARGGWETSRNVRARVVGIAAPPEQPTGLEQAYFMPPSPLRFNPGNAGTLAEYPVLTDHASFERVARDFVPDTPTRFGWRLLFDHTRLPFSRSPEARTALLNFQNEISDYFVTQDPRLNFDFRTQLINFELDGGRSADQGVLLAYERSVRSLDAPFGLLLVQVGALVIFFLLVTAALVRRNERREIAMLQSRGAVDRDIVAIRSIEAFLICLFAALIAPVIAQNVLILITPFFANYPDLPLLLTPTVFVYAAVAAGAAFFALMTTLRPVLRLPLITSGGSTLRSDRQPWWQRYYLDVVVTVLGLAALWRLVGRESPLFVTSVGGRSTDPFLLLAPALLFLGLGSILLRLFPTLAAAASRILASGHGMVGTLATWQLSREPLHYGRITFLLALAIGIGWFATSFRATVNRSQSDQAQYRVGTDVRVNERDLRLNAARARAPEFYTQIPGVEAVSVVWRRPFVNIGSTQNALLAQVLAVDPATFRDVIYWRPDLGTVEVPPASEVLPERGEVLPFAPRKLSVWANFSVWSAFGEHVPDLERLRFRTTIYARMLDSTGAWIRVPFRVAEIEYVSTGEQRPGVGGGGTFITNGWARLEADVSSDNTSYHPVGDVRLVSLYWSHRGRNQQGERFLRLTLTGLTAEDANGTWQPLDVLTRPGWQFALDGGAPAQGGIYAAASQHGTGFTAEWDQSAELSRVGALINYPDVPEISGIASAGALAQLNLAAGQSVQVRDLDNITVQIVGSQPYYPTLYDSLQSEGVWINDGQNRPFLIVERDALLYHLNRRPGAAIYADEVWLRTEPGTDTEAVLAALRPAADSIDRSAALVSAQTLSGELANLRTDPLSLGLLGLMLLAFLIAMALSVVGLLTYAALTAAARRTEFGVLRALGLSSARLIGQLAFEQIFVIGLATALGGVLGGVLSSQVVPRLAQDTSSRSITPPFVVQVETAALLQYGALIGLVLLSVLLLSLLLVRRMSLTRTLRLGED